MYFSERLGRKQSIEKHKATDGRGRIIPTETVGNSDVVEVLKRM
jgi:hypothetical protein